MAQSLPFATALKLGSGVVVWALHFAVVTTLTGLVCARGASATWWGASLVAWGVAAAGVVALAALGTVIVRSLRAPSPCFVDGLSGGLAALAALAIVWESLPVAMDAPCR